MKTIQAVLATLLLFSFSGVSSQALQTTLKPHQLVQSYKEQQIQFSKVDLLKKATTSETSSRRAETRINELSLLDVDSTQLQWIYQQTPEAIELSIPQTAGEPIQLELVKVDLFTPSFSVISSKNNLPVVVNTGIHYQGIVKGQQTSLASISIFEDELFGVVSTEDNGNLSLGRFPTAEEQSHALFPAAGDANLATFECGTEDTEADYRHLQLSNTQMEEAPERCVRVYFEVDHDIFLDKGGMDGTVAYISALFNQVATLYANEQINLVVSEMLVWDQPSPYSGTSSSQLLFQFQAKRTSFNGDLGQLLSYQASGGIAVLDGLCHPNVAARMSFSSINSSFAPLPDYSFSVMVVAHEFGHLLGSRHTHACVWNGNNTAIDACAGFTEGDCPPAGQPSDGGTIMSYCHIAPVGINFTKGFGLQPGNVIRNFINNANCTSACEDNFECSENEVVLTMQLDQYSSETSWEIIEVNTGNTVVSKELYSKDLANQQIKELLCLADGCYQLIVRDAYGDGICCKYGNGSFLLTDATGRFIGSGALFGKADTVDFCVPTLVAANCIRVDFGTQAIQSYGNAQDQGDFQLLDNNQVLLVKDNAWKAIHLDYTVTTSTILEFEFRSTQKGEVHAIGFDENDALTASRTFKLYGSQAYGIQTYDQYVGNGSWQKVIIPVGEHYLGSFSRLFFASDKDQGVPTSNSYFRDIKIYEGEGCENAMR